jgi:hypothetical protein
MNPKIINTRRNTLDFRSELEGILHPIAVSLVELMDLQTYNYHYKTLAAAYIEVRRKRSSSGNLAAQMMFSGDEIYLILFDEFKVGGSVQRGSTTLKTWSRGQCNAVYSFSNPAFGIEEIADRFAYIITTNDMT